MFVVYLFCLFTVSSRPSFLDFFFFIYLSIYLSVPYFFLHLFLRLFIEAFRPQKEILCHSEAARYWRTECALGQPLLVSNVAFWTGKKYQLQTVVFRRRFLLFLLLLLLALPGWSGCLQCLLWRASPCCKRGRRIYLSICLPTYLSIIRSVIVSIEVSVDLPLGLGCIHRSIMLICSSSSWIYLSFHLRL